MDIESIVDMQYLLDVFYSLVSLKVQCSKVSLNEPARLERYISPDTLDLLTRKGRL